MSALRGRVERLSGEQRALLAHRLGLPAGGDAGGAHRADAGPRLVAYVVPRERGDAAPAPAELRAFLVERLPEYMVPAVVLVDHVPRMPNGKVDVRALPAARPAESGGGAERAGVERFAEPRTAAEATLARIWADVLGGARVSVHDNFFEIGGDSILGIQVVARARQAGLSLTPDLLFRHQTVAELAAAAETAVAASAAGDAEQGRVTGAVPLSPIQHWFFEQALAEPSHWHHVLPLDVPGDADPSRLAEAARQVVLHHDALRLRFEREGPGWRQAHGSPDAAVAVRRVDVAALPRAEQERAVRDAADALARDTDLAAGPLVAALVAARGGGCPDQLVLVIHHLVVDPISWPVIVEDLNTAYAQLARGDPVALPRKTSSFRAWSEALARYAGSERLRAEGAYWLSAAREAPRIPVDLDGAFTEASARTVAVTLGADETDALLHRVPAAYNTPAEPVLLTALARAVGAWMGADRLLVGLERHGREAVADGIDVSRTVGWFTSFFPVTIDLGGSSRPGEALKVVKEQLHRVPERGVGYGVLRYLGPDPEVRERLTSALQPEVIFNYAGRVAAAAPDDAALRPAGLPAASRAPRNGRHHLLEVNASIAGGRLRVEWTYSTNVHRTATVERLADGYVRVLRGLIDHCLSADAGGYTPSDFPEAGLSQEELDRFLGGLLE